MKTISAGQHIYAFAPDLVSVETIQLGERVRFATLDALGGQVRLETDVLAALDFDRVNPATGPITIADTRAGDTLAVHILAIEIDGQGAIVTGPGMGVLGDEMHNHATRILPVRDGQVHFGNLTLPAKPMIGVIGVAPQSGVIPTGTAHRHGGNMDAKEVGAGATVYLPVFQEGAMLAMGDVHAVMGDGEVCVSACEIGAHITLRCERIAGRSFKWPIVETDHAIHILVSMPSIEDALIEATRQAVGLLQRARGTSAEDAYMLASLAVDIGISQLVDPNKTAKASIPKAILPGAIGDLL